MPSRRPIFLVRLTVFWLLVASAATWARAEARRPAQITIDAVTRSSNGVVKLAGRAWPPGTGAHYVVAFAHSDVFYRHPRPARLSPGGRFSLALPIRPEVDRLTLVLLTARGLRRAGCQSNCYGVLDRSSGTDHRIPVALDGRDALAFATTYFAADAADADAQIADLLGRLSRVTADPRGSGLRPARLVRSFRDREQHYLYDQALAAIAFARAGRRRAAQRVLNALANLQLPSGGWYYSYGADGRSIYPAAGDRRHAGAIAWVVIAVNGYAARFGDQGFDPMARRAIGHLDRQRITVDHGGTTTRAVRLNPTDLPGTTWDESRVVSFENNASTYAAVRGFARRTGEPRHEAMTEDLRRFLESMWDGRRYLVGFDTSNGRPNRDATYLDPQTWGTLALGSDGERGARRRRALRTSCERLLVSVPSPRRRGRVLGLVDRAGQRPPDRFVWSEGTLGMVLALGLVNRATGVNTTCGGHGPADLLASIASQSTPQGGIPYAIGATRTSFSTSSSVAATAWLYFARQGFNPMAAPDGAPSVV